MLFEITNYAMYIPSFIHIRLAVTEMRTNILTNCLNVNVLLTSLNASNYRRAHNIVYTYPEGMDGCVFLEARRRYECVVSTYE